MLEARAARYSLIFPLELGSVNWCWWLFGFAGTQLRAESAEPARLGVLAVCDVGCGSARHGSPRDPASAVSSLRSVLQCCCSQSMDLLCLGSGLQGVCKPKENVVNSAALTDSQKAVRSAADPWGSGRGRYSAQRLPGGLELMRLTRTAAAQCSAVSKQRCGARPGELCLGCLTGRSRSVDVSSDSCCALAELGRALPRRPSPSAQVSLRCAPAGPWAGPWAVSSVAQQRLFLGSPEP